MNRTHNATRNILTGIINKLLTILFPFIIRTVIIRTLGMDYNGLNGLFTSLLQLLSLAELGFGAAMIFSMYKPIAENDTVFLCALLNLYRKIYRIVGTAILVAGLAVTPFIHYFIKGGYPAEINIYILYLIYLLNTVLSYFLYTYRSSLMIAYQRADIGNNINTFTAILLFLLQLTSLMVFRSYYLFVIFIPVTTIVYDILNAVISYRKYPKIRCAGTLPRETVKAIMKRVIALSVYKICSVLRTSMSSVIISSFLGLIVLSVYQNYFYVITSISVFLSIMLTSLTATIGNSVVKEDVSKNYRDFNCLLFLFLWISGWCTVFLLCLYQPFMTLWCGEEFLYPFVVVISLCVYFYCLQMGNIVFMYRESIGLWWEDKIRPIVESIVNLVLSLILIQFMGVTGVVLSTVISIVFINFYWSARVIFKYYFKCSCKAYIKRQLFWAIRTLIACGATYSVCILQPLAGIPGLCVRFLSCLIIPPVAFYFLSFRSDDYRDSVRFIKQVVKDQFAKI